MQVINAITGEGTQSSSYLLLSERKPESVRNVTLENLYHWSIGGRAVRLVPLSVMGAAVTVDPQAEALYLDIFDELIDTWCSARLFGSAWLSADRKIIIGEPKNSQEQCLAHFIGIRNVGLRRSKNYYSVLIPGYDALLKYGMALTVGSHLLQKYSFISYPVVNFLQNAQDPDLVCSLKSIVGDMQSLGVLPYDASGKVPAYAEVDLDKFQSYVESLAQAVSSHLSIPHSLLFAKSPDGVTSGKFEIAQWVSHLRIEANQLKRAWAAVTKFYGYESAIEVDFSTTLDLYTGKEVNQTV